MLLFKKNTYNQCLLGCCFLSLSFDLGGEVGIRNPTIFICGALIILGNTIVYKKRYLFYYSLLILYPLIMFFVGITNNANVEVAMSQYKSTFFAFLLLFLIPIIQPRKAAYTLIFALASTAFFATLIFIGISLKRPEAWEIIHFLLQKGGGYFGERGIGTDLVPNIYFKSTLFYTVGYIFSLFYLPTIISIIFFLGLLAGVSKAGMLYCGISTCLYAYYKKKSIKILLLIVFMASFFIGIINLSPIKFLYQEVLEGNSKTVMVRKLHFESLISYWETNPVSFIIGSGLGTSFYSQATGTQVYNIEIDHFNITRKYGIIWFLLFSSRILLVGYKAIKSQEIYKKRLGLSLITAFIVCGTNPVLLSPLFFCLLFITENSIENKTHRREPNKTQSCHFVSNL